MCAPSIVFSGGLERTTANARPIDAGAGTQSSVALGAGAILVQRSLLPGAFKGCLHQCSIVEGGLRHAEVEKERSTLVVGANHDLLYCSFLQNRTSRLLPTSSDILHGHLSAPSSLSIKLQCLAAPNEHNSS